ncbi:MAG: catalase [Pyrinomonadaceae bacterium]|nr:catalase [Pyrinomonadaceae bacterium]
MTTRKDSSRGKDKVKSAKVKVQTEDAKREELTLNSPYRGHDAKIDDLEKNAEDSAGEFLTTNQGVRINDNQNSLKAGDRGPTLLEDFFLREKITHFDHERIPERVVHARGSAAHGYFQVYESMAHYTKAGFLQDPSVKTPVFVRFSTVAGSRGSSDLARDVRGFAVKFYTQEGNYDLVGNNIPIFFIQDAIKFPDLIHAVKPEPHNEIPQAASAHDTFWDFISLMPESMHMIMWVMSDRAIPRSLRMMEGFGVHTFRFINDRGKARFVKFHWKPVLGLHSVLWDEAQQISGKDPDFHRRDLWEAIENGDFPEWEFGVQIVEEKDEHSFNFDLLDPTKIIPEEIVPVRRIGKMTLNRNPDNFFAETEQVAFHTGHVVPGIDFTNDPLLQGRLFSYLDTQLLRLGGPNFHEIPINRPVAPVHNNQRDGFMRQTINKGQSAHDPNTVRGGCPFQAGADMGGFTSFAERIDAHKIRARSPSFFDHFSQATLFYNSQSEPEKNHIVRAFRFELGKLETPAIRERMLGLLAQVDKGLASQVAEGLGISVPSKLDKPLNMSIPADADPRKFQPKRVPQGLEESPALSMVNNPNFPNDTIKTRKIAFLVADGFDDVALSDMKKALMTAGALPKTVAPRLGVLTGAKGEECKADFSFLTGSSVLFDAVYLPGGDASVAALKVEPEALNFVNEAYNHCKAIAASGAGVALLTGFLGEKFIDKTTSGESVAAYEGVVTSRGAATDHFALDFIEAISQHRHWERERRT